MQSNSNRAKPGRLLRRVAGVGLAVTLVSCVAQKRSWDDWVEAEPPIAQQGTPLLATPAVPAEAAYPLAESYALGDGAVVGRGFDLAMRNPGFPETYIAEVHVNLTDQRQGLEITWVGPLSGLGPVGPWRFTPGSGMPGLDCNDVGVSNSVDSFCTPKGVFPVAGFADHLDSVPSCLYATWVLHAPRYIAMHSHTDLPFVPASHGCLRMPMEVAKLIHNNSKVGTTQVRVDGTWQGTIEDAAPSSTGP